VSKKEQIIKVREGWLNEIDIDFKEELLFEVELYLKALDRFFNQDNLPEFSVDPVSRNYFVEIKIIKGILKHLRKLFDKMLTGEDTSNFIFQHYIENRLLPDYARDKFYEKYILQPTPKDSLYLLIITFENLFELINSLVLLPKINLSVYQSIGQIISRTIASSRFFNPFIYKGFSVLYDKISNPEINRIVKNIKDKKLKKSISSLILTMNRFLHYLDYVNVELTALDSLRRNIVIFSLINSEARNIMILIEKDIPDNLKIDNSEEFTAEKGAVIDFVDGLSFQLTIELRKINQQILRDFCQATNILKVKSAVENAQGILKNFFQQNIVNILQIFDSELDGRSVFKDFISRFEESLRLREDLYIFIKLSELIINELDKDGLSRVKTTDLFSALNDFILYFRNLTFKSVRYSDHEEFVNFFDWISKITSNELLESIILQAEMKKRLHSFKIFLETTKSQVENRAELHNVSLDKEKAEIILNQFIN